MEEPHLLRETEPGNFGLSDDLLFMIWLVEEQLAADVMSIHQHKQIDSPEVKHTHIDQTECYWQETTYEDRHSAKIVPKDKEISTTMEGVHEAAQIKPLKRTCSIRAATKKESRGWQDQLLTSSRAPTTENPHDIFWTRLVVSPKRAIPDYSTIHKEPA